MAPPRFSRDDVRDYYDTNTAAFIRHGQGGSVGALHRAVWGPGVANRPEAFHYVEQLIVRDIDRLGVAEPVVLDLGCGVGASLTHIAEARPIRGIGVTLSPVQARVGSARVAALGLGARVRILEGDYGTLPELEPVDLAYAIESFVHGPSPDRFFTEAARVIRPGGLLLVCDDVRVEGAGPQVERTLRQFARGWHVNSLLTPEALASHASSAGFLLEATTDLTPYLELGRLRDRVLALVAGAAARLPMLPRRLAPMVGGAALQRALARGWIAYHYAVFRRRRA